MFALPEILWSPVVNFLYIFSRGGNVPVVLRDNFLVHPDYRKLAITVIFLQCLGALLGLVLTNKLSIKIIYKVLLSILFVLFFVLSIVVFFILLATVNASFF